MKLAKLSVIFCCCSTCNAKGDAGRTMPQPGSPTSRATSQSAQTLDFGFRTSVVQVYVEKCRLAGILMGSSQRSLIHMRSPVSIMAQRADRVDARRLPRRIVRSKRRDQARKAGSGSLQPQRKSENRTFELDRQVARHYRTHPGVAGE